MQDRNRRQRGRIRKTVALKHVTDTEGRTGIAGTATLFSHQVLPSKSGHSRPLELISGLARDPRHLGRGLGACCQYRTE